MTKQEAYIENITRILPEEAESVEVNMPDGNYFNLERTDDRWYIVVIHKSGSKMYDGYAPNTVLTLKDAIREAVNGSQAYLED